MSLELEPTGPAEEPEDRLLPLGPRPGPCVLELCAGGYEALELDDGYPGVVELGGMACLR